MKKKKVSLKQKLMDALVWVLGLLLWIIVGASMVALMSYGIQVIWETGLTVFDKYLLSFSVLLVALAAEGILRGFFRDG